MRRGNILEHLIEFEEFIGILDPVRLAQCA